MENEKTHKRFPFISGIFSLLLPGLGQLYNGQLRKGVIFFLSIIFIDFIFFLFSVFKSFPGLALYVVLEIFVRLFIIADALYYSIKSENYVKQKYNNWKVYLAAVVFAWLFFTFFPIREIISLETSRVVSRSMQPTIQPEDYVMIDEGAYNQDSPDYGDIVSFIDIRSGEIWAFRIVGLPGDTVQIQDEFVSINGNPPDIQLLNPDAAHTYLYSESLPNDKVIYVYKFIIPDEGVVINTDKLFIPDDTYYVLGDNRSDAYDSRYIGLIDKNKIRGRLLYIYYSPDQDRIGIDLTTR